MHNLFPVQNQKYLRKDENWWKNTLNEPKKKKLPKKKKKSPKNPKCLKTLYKSFKIEFVLAQLKFSVTLLQSHSSNLLLYFNNQGPITVKNLDHYQIFMIKEKCVQCLFV